MTADGPPMKLLTFLSSLLLGGYASGQIQPLVSTYLGDGSRNYYGDRAPTALRVKWKTYLGSGKTQLGPRVTKTWKGAGWTGQPLVISEDGEIYLIQGTLSHHLKKIRARDGKVVWSTNVGDVIKGTPTFTDVGGGTAEQRYVLITGSRSGFGVNFETGPAWSLHGISYLTGKKLWRHNSRRTASISRDVDASALVLSGGKAIVPLENGYLTVLSPDVRKARGTGIPAPKIFSQTTLFRQEDLRPYQGDICPESSPTLYKGKVYTAAGPGRVHRYSSGIFGGNKVILNVGGDLNGTMPVTGDGHFLLGIEKQVMEGQGGVMKFTPGGKVKWFAPTKTKRFYSWEGGLVGSPAVNARYRSVISNQLACFVGVEGMLTLVDHTRTQPGVRVAGPRKSKSYPTPVVLDQVQLPSGSISSPLFLGDKIVVGYDRGLDLYQVTEGLKLRRLARLPGVMFDATPVCWGGRVYAASKNGYLYCLGD